MDAPRLNLVVLRTPEPDRLCGFYALLGLRFRQEQHGKGPVHFACQSAGGLVLEIYPLDAGQPADASVRLGFAVTGIQALCQVIRSEGHTVRSDPRPSPWGVRAVLQDPDGRAVELLEAGAGS